MTRGLCAFEGCERRRCSANGFCGTHNWQYKQGYELMPIGATRKKEGATCEICQADISDRRPDAKYCSKTCSQKAYVRNNFDRVKVLKAAEYLRNKERNRPKRDETALKAKEARADDMGIDLSHRRCAICGADIPGRRRLDARYCSVKCNKKASRDRNPEHTKQLKKASYKRNRENTLEKSRERYAANKAEIGLRGQARTSCPHGDCSRQSPLRFLPRTASYRTYAEDQVLRGMFRNGRAERSRIRSNWTYLRTPEEIKARVRAYARSPRGRAMRHAWVATHRRYLREYKRSAHRQRVGYDPSGRRCADCGDGLPIDAGHRAKYCPTCRERRFGPRAWSCVVCGKEFSRKRARAPLCSKACRSIRRKAIRKAEYDALRREWREGRTCRRPECGKSISELPPNEVFCPRCKKVQKEKRGPSLTTRAEREKWAASGMCPQTSNLSAWRSNTTFVLHLGVNGPSGRCSSISRAVPGEIMSLTTLSHWCGMGGTTTPTSNCSATGAIGESETKCLTNGIESTDTYTFRNSATNNLATMSNSIDAKVVAVGGLCIKAMVNPTMPRQHRRPCRHPATPFPLPMTPAH